MMTNRQQNTKLVPFPESNHSINSCRKIYRRGALLALATAATAVALAPNADAAEQKQVNIEPFFKLGNDRMLGGVDIVVPFMRSSEAMPFLDLKGKVDDDDGFEVNLGLGYRRFNAAGDWLMGGWLAYDIRETTSDNTFNWVSGGFEALSHQYDFRANFYYTSDDPEVISTGGGYFTGTSVMQFKTLEEPQSGGDIEAGMLLPFSDAVESRLYLAGYHFTADDTDDVTGARLRLEVRPRKNIILGFEAAYDDIREEQVFAELRFSFGNSGDKGIRTLKERMIDPVKRDIDGPVSFTSGYRPYVDPITGTTPRFIHIDNLNDEDAGQQDGSLAHPYSSLENYYTDNANQPNSVLVIHQGDGTANGLDQTLVLENNQSIWGEGAPPFPISGFGTSGLWPQMTANDGEAVIQLANNNEITGVTVLPVDDGVGILGGNLGFVQDVLDGNRPDLDTLTDSPAEGVTGFNIHNTNILSNEYYSVGVGITTINGASSSGRITDNTINTGLPILLANGSGNGSTSRQNVYVSGNEVFAQHWYGGMLVLNGDYGPGNTAIQNVTINNNTINSAYYGVNIGNYAGNNGSATQTVDISGNTILARWDDGIYAFNMAGVGESDASTATQNLTVLNNSINSEDYHGVHVDNNGYGAATAISNATISNNVINSDNDGVYLYNYGENGDVTARQTVTVSSNRITSEYDGIDASNSDVAPDEGGGTQDLTITGNTITADDYGIYLGNWDTGTQLAMVSGNNISSDEEGIEITNNGGGLQDVTATGNTINSDDDGFDIENSNGGTQLIDITGNIIHAESESGIEAGNWDDGSYQKLLIEDNTITAYDYGIDAYNSNNATQIVDIINNTINAYDYGIYLDNDDTGTQTVRIEGNTIFVYDYGIYAENSETGTQTIDIIDNNVTSLNYGIYIENNATGGLQTVNIKGNFVSSNDGYYAIYVTNNNSGTQEVDIEDNEVMTDDYGIYVANWSNGLQEIDDISGNTINSGDDYGIYVLNNSNGTQTVNAIDRNTIQSGDHSIHIENNSGTQTIGSISDNMVQSDDDTIDIQNYGGTQTVNHLARNTANSLDWGIQISNTTGTQNVYDVSGNIVNATSDGLYISNGTGTQTVENSGNIINSSDYGILIRNSGGTQEITIENDTVRGLDGGVRIDGTGSNQLVSLLGNNISSSGDGVVIDNQGTTILGGNTITNNTGDGVDIRNNAADVDMGGGESDDSGGNRIFNNLGSAIRAWGGDGASTVMAQNNWWGMPPNFNMYESGFPAGFFVEENGADIDVSDALTRDPGE